MIRFLSLAEFFWLADQITGIPAETLTAASRIDLADSALHAPRAEFGGIEFYPDVFDKAAVLTCRLAWNHPLPDGNKRASWVALAMFIDLNRGSWTTGEPSEDDAVRLMLDVAAHIVDEAFVADWLRERVTFHTKERALD